MKAIPITVDGVTYPSKTQFCRQTGFNKSTLRKSEKKGLPIRKRHRGQQELPVAWNGRIFKDTFAAADALGIHPTTVRQYIHTGREYRGSKITRPSELDLVLEEIRERNRQPYQFSRP